MQSFDTKDSNTLESFNRKLESSDTSGRTDSEVKQSDNNSVESYDRKIEGFDTFSTRDLELEQADDEFVESLRQGKRKLFQIPKVSEDSNVLIQNLISIRI